MKKYIEIGKIVNTHGLYGQLKVQLWCDSPDFFMEFDEFYLKNEKKIKISDMKMHKNMMLVSIEGINNINEAEKLKESVLYINRDEIELAEDRVFIQDLIGLTVFDIRQNRNIGTLKEVLPNPANDLYLIENGKNTYLIPAVNEFLRDVNFETSVITVETIEGMADDNEN